MGVIDDHKDLVELEVNYPDFFDNFMDCLYNGLEQLYTSDHIFKLNYSHEPLAKDGHEWQGGITLGHMAWEFRISDNPCFGTTIYYFDKIEAEPEPKPKVRKFRFTGESSRVLTKGDTYISTKEGWIANDRGNQGEMVNQEYWQEVFDEDTAAVSALDGLAALYGLRRCEGTDDQLRCGIHKLESKEEIMARDNIEKVKLSIDIANIGNYTRCSKREVGRFSVDYASHQKEVLNTTKQEKDMKIELNVAMVDGQRASELSDTALISRIDSEVNKADVLQKLLDKSPIKSKAMQVMVMNHLKNAEELAKILDSNSK